MRSSSSTLVALRLARMASDSVASLVSNRQLAIFSMYAFDLDSPSDRGARGVNECVLRYWGAAGSEFLPRSDYRKAGDISE